MSGNQCCENPPTLSSSSGAGQVQQLGGLNCYVSGLADSQFAVLLISDIFGYEAPNLRKLADKVAAAGFYTVVPDFLYGDPYVPEKQPISLWIKDHGTDKGFEDAKPVIEALKSKGVTKIGAAGFCWGAKVVVELGKHPYIEAGMSPPELVKQFEAALNAKPEIDGFVKIFPGVSHGWSVRYKDDDALSVRSAEEAHRDMLDWFAKYLK
ncbi:hypothetical protein BUALT_Bualt14G0090000 [Buddleja alternifolia]|uniref:Dienelactone hydrolase domain-containing protein n=1 Tax=Buddleja alternifolia TaxID=168488 RepID=A0AAV6WI60_9LAMI|nr:hypothetical protein BUALT_Bualt14G0090000 [Buddleja alternifolia]